MYKKHPNILSEPLILDEKVLSWVQHIPFAFFAVSALKPTVLVELGVHSGNSYNAFCQAVKSLKLPSKCYGVDNWTGDEHAGFYANNIYDVLAKQQADNYSEFSTLLRMNFKDALSEFEDASIDLLHIDGMHTYDAVKEDFYDWLPKMKDDGVVLFHDSHVFIREFGVHQLLDELKNEFPVFQFEHGHGLSVLLVNKKENPVVQEFFVALNDENKQLFERLGERIYLKEMLKRKPVFDKTNFFKLYYAEGKPFKEQFSLQLPISGHPAKANINFGDINQANFIRLDPWENPVIIKNLIVSIKNEEKEAELSPSYSNVTETKDNYLYFNNSDPQLHYNVPSGFGANAIIYISFQLIAKNNNTERAWQNIK